MSKLSLILAVVVSLTLACHSAPDHRNNAVFNQYQLRASTVVDYDRNVGATVVDIRRDSVVTSRPHITFGFDTLAWNLPYPWATGYFGLTFDPVDSLHSRFVPLVVVDSTFLTDTTFATIPDTFTILTVDPPNRIMPGLRNVSLSWSGSQNADGYVLAAVRRPFAYSQFGYSKFVMSLNPAGTLPPDAFALNPAHLPDTGWYYLYVYAFTGAPDSVLTAPLLPVPLPAQLPDTIYHRNLTGRQGTVVIAHRDSVHLVTQP